MAFFRDIRHGLRTLRRVPGLVAVAAITLALGIGANTAIFSVIIGIAAGLVAALLLSPLIQSLLFHVTARDPLTYASVAAILIATAVLACIVPARQALRTDVVAALRAE